MQTNHTRTAGAVIAVIAAGGVGYSLRPSAQPAALTARTPAAEVRTVVIRRTIHIVRHERVRPPVRPAGSNSGSQTGSQAAGRSAGQPMANSAPLKTTTSKHASTSTPSATSGTTHSAPVTTRTSTHGSTDTTGAGRPVTTRTSTGHGDDGGGGDG